MVANDKIMDQWKCSLKYVCDLFFSLGGVKPCGTIVLFIIGDVRPAESDSDRWASTFYRHNGGWRHAAILFTKLDESLAGIKQFNNVLSRHVIHQIELANGALI